MIISSPHYTHTAINFTRHSVLRIYPIAKFSCFVFLLIIRRKYFSIIPHASECSITALPHTIQGWIKNSKRMSTKAVFETLKRFTTIESSPMFFISIKWVAEFRCWILLWVIINNVCSLVFLLFQVPYGSFTLFPLKC